MVGNVLGEGVEAPTRTRVVERVVVAGAALGAQGAIHPARGLRDFFLARGNGDSRLPRGAHGREFRAH